MNTPLLKAISEHISTRSPADLIRAYDFSVSNLIELKSIIAQEHLSQPAKAMKMAQRTYEVSLLLSPTAAAIGHWIMGQALQNEGRYTLALEQLTQAQTIFSAQQETAQAVRVGVDSVVSLAYSGQLNRALTFAQKIEPILTEMASRNRQDMQHLVWLLTHVGLIYKLMGRYEDALSHYDKIMQRIISSGDSHLLAQVNYQQARVFSQLGAVEEAISAYDHAEILWYSSHATLHLVRLYLNRNSLLIATKRYSEATQAQTFIQQLLTTTTGLEQSVHRLTLLRVQLYLSKIEQVPLPLLGDLHSAKSWFVANGPTLEHGLCWILLGSCSLQYHDLEQARSCYTSVLTMLDLDVACVRVSRLSGAFQSGGYCWKQRRGNFSTPTSD